LSIKKSWLSTHPFYVTGTAYGGLFSHSKSMVKYCKSLMPGDETFLVESTKEHLNKDGQLPGMSLGWFTGNVKKLKYLWHAGGGAGYYT